MANEFTFAASITYEDSEGTEITIALPANVQKSITTKKFIHAKQAIGTSEEAIQLGEVSGATLGYFIFLNLDTSNYLEIRSGTGASNDILRLDSTYGFAVGRWGSDVTAPYAIANTAACQMEYIIWAA